MQRKSLDINFSLMIVERIVKGEFSSSGCTLEVGKKKQKREKQRKVSFKGMSLELKIRGWGMGGAWT